MINPWINIIFLDIDGVLCIEKYLDNLPNQSPWYDQFGDLFDPLCINRLKQLVTSSTFQIVISSDWRHKGLPFLQQMWQFRQLPGEIVGITPYHGARSNLLESTRLSEIKAFLQMHRFMGKYLIIDDMNIQSPQLVRTDPDIGLKGIDIDTVLKRYNIYP